MRLLRVLLHPSSLGCGLGSSSLIFFVKQCRVRLLSVEHLGSLLGGHVEHQTLTSPTSGMTISGLGVSKYCCIV